MNNEGMLLKQYMSVFFQPGYFYENQLTFLLNRSAGERRIEISHSKNVCHLKTRSRLWFR